LGLLRGLPLGWRWRRRWRLRGIWPRRWRPTQDLLEPFRCSSVPRMDIQRPSIEALRSLDVTGCLRDLPKTVERICVRGVERDRPLECVSSFLDFAAPESGVADLVPVSSRLSQKNALRKLMVHARARSGVGAGAAEPRRLPCQVGTLVKSVSPAAEAVNEFGLCRERSSVREREPDEERVVVGDMPGKRVQRRPPRRMEAKEPLIPSPAAGAAPEDSSPSTDHIADHTALRRFHEGTRLAQPSDGASRTRTGDLLGAIQPPSYAESYSFAALYGGAPGVPQHLPQQSAPRLAEAALRAAG